LLKLLNNLKLFKSLKPEF